MTTKLKDYSIVFIIFMLCTIMLASHLPYLAQRIENKLSYEIQQALHTHDMDWVDVAVDGRDVTLSGMANTREEYNKILKLVKELPGIRQLDNRITVQIKRVTPYTFTAEYHQDKLILTGYVPNIETQHALKKQLENTFGQRLIQNELQLASGEPAHWEKAITTILNNLNQFQRARLEVINYDVRLSGMLETEQAIRDVKEKLAVIKDYHYHPNFYLKVAYEKPPLRNPYTLIAEYQANTHQLELSGYLPDTITQQTVIKEVNTLFAESQVQNNLTLASGEPMQWQKVLLTLFANLSQFERGRLEVINYNVRLAGIVPTTPQINTIKQNLQPLEDYHYRLQLYLQAADEKPPLQRVNPYTLTADYREHKLQLDGYFPSETARDDVIETVKKLFMHEEIVHDGLKVASGDPAQWQTTIILLLNALRQFKHGHLEVSNYEARLTGQVASTKTVRELENDVSRLLEHDYHLQLYVQAADTQILKCQRQFSNLLSSSRITFESSSVLIQASSYDLLESLVSAAKECPDAEITIAGHTDAIGDAQRNLQLSQQRAEVVRRYLIRNGIDGTKIKAVGYGESRPIADNDTEASRAKNRRIEFIIEGY